MVKPRFFSTRSALIERGYVGVFAVVASSAASVRAQDDPPETLNLAGVIRDFRPYHPDFAITDPDDIGHYVRSVSPALDATKRPHPSLASCPRTTTSWRSGPRCSRCVDARYILRRA